MFDTMKITKVVASLAGTLLILLFVIWGARVLYQVGPGEEEGAKTAETTAPQGYIIAANADAASTSSDTAAPAPQDFSTVYASADADKGKKIFNKCKACHKIEDGVNATGPSLYGVVGRPVATEAGYSYSDALKALGGDWTPDRLDEWLTSPKDYAPGTKMTFAGLKKIEDRANVIAYLATLGG
jgi:cytochrome c